jgi:predicted nucleic acid-binding protein
MEEMINFLIQFKETLEFILANIGIDNLSDELVNKLNSLGAEIEKTNEVKEEEMQQVSNKMLTVSDVINSEAFKSALTNEYQFTVNFDTGNLEYTR